MAVPEMLSTKALEGDKVVNEQGDKLGDIKDVMIDMQTGSVAYVVLSFGGILGIGNKLFGIPLEAMRKKPDEHAFILNVDKERLKNAPGFDKDQWPGTSAGESYDKYVTSVYDYYGYECPYNARIYGEALGTRDKSLEEPSGRTMEGLGGVTEKGRTLTEFGNPELEEPGGRTLESPRRKATEEELIASGKTLEGLGGVTEEGRTLTEFGNPELEEPGGRTLKAPHRRTTEEELRASDQAACTAAAAAGGITEDIYSILKNEHARVMNLFDEAISSGSKDTFMQIRTELYSHMNGEEEVLYPVLRDRDRTHDIALEGYQEHHVAKMLLSELEVMDERSDMWIPKLKVLKENVKHHVEEEEKQMFPDARNELSKSESKEVAQKYLDFKSQYRV